MEKGATVAAPPTPAPAADQLVAPIRAVQTGSPAKSSTTFSASLNRSTAARAKKVDPPKLLSLCLGFLGEHLEDIILDISDIADALPPYIRLAILAIARRRKLLNDHVIVSLADLSFKILDLSGSDVTDIGLASVAKICTNLRAVDITRCENVTDCGVSELIHHCRSLETLRCGGSPRAEITARRCLSLFKPKLNTFEEESWEELDETHIAAGAESLRWLIWPKIDENSKSLLNTECPRIVVNPQQSSTLSRVLQLPAEALGDVPLDQFVVEDIDPKTWAAVAAPGQTSAAASDRGLNATQLSSDKPEIPIAERFRLAFVEREARLAIRRAKKERQERRRAAREYWANDINGKSIALAAQASKFLHKF